MKLTWECLRSLWWKLLTAEESVEVYPAINEEDAADIRGGWDKPVAPMFPLSDTEQDSFESTAKRVYNNCVAEYSEITKPSGPPLHAEIDTLTMLEKDLLEESQPYGEFYGQIVRACNLKEVLKLRSRMDIVWLIAQSSDKVFPTLEELGKLSANETVCDDAIVRQRTAYECVGYDQHHHTNELRTVEDHNTLAERLGTPVSRAEALAALDTGEMVMWNFAETGKNFIVSPEAIGETL